MATDEAVLPLLERLSTPQADEVGHAGPGLDHPIPLRGGNPARRGLLPRPNHTQHIGRRAAGLEKTFERIIKMRARQRRAKDPRKLTQRFDADRFKCRSARGKAHEHRHIAPGEATDPARGPNRVLIDAWAGQH